MLLLEFRRRGRFCSLFNSSLTPSLLSVLKELLLGLLLSETANRFDTDGAFYARQAKEVNTTTTTTIRVEIISIRKEAVMTTKEGKEVG